jgi:hypothetical protein
VTRPIRPAVHAGFIAQSPAQHLAGGCILGEAANDGAADRERTGSVKGAHNVVVADLSACPLPRVSPQMTAYLVGYHVAAQRYGKRAAPARAPAAPAGAAAAPAGAAQDDQDGPATPRADEARRVG